MYNFVFLAKYRRLAFDKKVDQTLAEVCLEIEKRYDIHFRDWY
jgi:hypothetical protein